MNVSLTPELEQLVNAKVKSGMYHSASEVIREGLRLLKEQDDLRLSRLNPLRQEVGATQQDDRLGLTHEQWERFQAFTQGYGEQDKNGVDLSLLRANLKLTPTERIEKMRRSLTLVQEVRHAGNVAGLSGRSHRTHAK